MNYRYLLMLVFILLFVVVVGKTSEHFINVRLDTEASNETVGLALMSQDVLTAQQNNGKPVITAKGDLNINNGQLCLEGTCIIKNDLNEIKNIKSVGSDITGLKSRDAAISSDITGLKSRDAAINSDITGLKSQDAAINSDITGLKSRDAAISNDITGLKSRDAAISSDITGLKSRDAAINSDIMGLKSRDAAISGQLSELNSKTADFMGLNISMTDLKNNMAKKANISIKISIYNVQADGIGNVNKWFDYEYLFKKYGLNNPIHFKYSGKLYRIIFNASENSQLRNTTFLESADNGITWTPAKNAFPTYTKSSPGGDIEIQEIDAYFSTGINIRQNDPGPLIEKNYGKMGDRYGIGQFPNKTMRVYAGGDTSANSTVNLSIAQADGGFNDALTVNKSGDTFIKNLYVNEAGQINQAGGDGWWNDVTKNGDLVILNRKKDLNKKANPEGGITLAPWNGAGGMRVHGAGVDINGKICLNNTCINEAELIKLKNPPIAKADGTVQQLPEKLCISDGTCLDSATIKKLIANQNATPTTNVDPALVTKINTMLPANGGVKVGRWALNDEGGAFVIRDTQAKEDGRYAFSPDPGNMTNFNSSFLNRLTSIFPSGYMNIVNRRPLLVGNVLHEKYGERLLVDMIYGPFGYNVPPVRPGAVRKFRIYAVYTDNFIFDNNASQEIQNTQRKAGPMIVLKQINDGTPYVFQFEITWGGWLKESRDGFSSLVDFKNNAHCSMTSIIPDYIKVHSSDKIPRVSWQYIELQALDVYP